MRQGQSLYTLTEIQRSVLLNHGDGNASVQFFFLFFLQLTTLLPAIVKTPLLWMSDILTHFCSFTSLLGFHNIDLK